MVRKSWYAAHYMEGCRRSMRQRELRFLRAGKAVANFDLKFRTTGLTGGGGFLVGRLAIGN